MLTLCSVYLIITIVGFLRKSFWYLTFDRGRHHKNSTKINKLKIQIVFFSCHSGFWRTYCLTCCFLLYCLVESLKVFYHNLKKQTKNPKLSRIQSQQRIIFFIGGWFGSFYRIVQELDDKDFLKNLSELLDLCPAVDSELWKMLHLHFFKEK